MQPQTPMTPAPGSSSRVAFGCLYAVAILFGGGGLLGLVTGIREYPSKPNAAVAIIVGGIFTLIGTGLLLGAWYGSAAAKKKDALQAANPGKPWMWREDWSRGIIQDSNKSGTIGIWIFAILWNAVSFPIATVTKKEFMGGNHVALLILLFPLIGIILLITAVYQTLRSMKFGTSQCHLDHVPIVPGRLFRGDVQLNSDVVPESGYHLRFTSTHAVTTGRGKSRTTRETLMFDSEIVVDASAAMRSPNGTRVPFQFATPPDSHPTDDSNMNDRYYWRLSIDADVPGVDYSAQFDVPVFRTGEAVDSSDYESFQQKRRAEVVRHNVKADSGVQVTRLPGGGEEFRLQAAKTFGSVFKSLFFLALWNAAIVAMIHFKAPWGFPVFFILIDVLLIIGSIDYFGGRTTVAADSKGLRVRKEWFGYGSSRAFEVASIESIDAMAIAAQKGSSYGIMLKLRDGKPQRLGAYIQDRESADIVAAKLMTDLGLGKASTSV